MKLELLVPDSMVGSLRADGTASLDGGLWLHDVCDAFADAVASRSRAVRCFRGGGRLLGLLAGRRRSNCSCRRSVGFLEPHPSRSKRLLQLAIVAMYGLCQSVRHGVVSHDYAVDKLFRPSLVKALARCGADPALIDLVEHALEVDGVADLAPRGLGPLLERLEAGLLAALRRTRPQEGGASWLLAR